MLKNRAEIEVVNANEDVFFFPPQHVRLLFLHKVLISKLSNDCSSRAFSWVDRIVKHKCHAQLFIFRARARVARWNPRKGPEVQFRNSERQDKKRKRRGVARFEVVVTSLPLSRARRKWQCLKYEARTTFVSAFLPRWCSFRGDIEEIYNTWEKHGWAGGPVWQSNALPPASAACSDLADSAHLFLQLPHLCAKEFQD